MRKTLVVLLLVLAPAAAWAGPGKTKAFTDACGYRLQVPPGVKIQKYGDCGLQMTWPPSDMIPDMTLTLEITQIQGGDDRSPAGDDGPVTVAPLVAGGLKFEKTLFGEGSAGHVETTVTYLAKRKTHQYQFTGLMRSVNPGMLDKPVKNWDPEKVAQKYFDGVVLTFRPLEP